MVSVLLYTVSTTLISMRVGGALTETYAQHTECAYLQYDIDDVPWCRHDSWYVVLRHPRL